MGLPPERPKKWSAGPDNGSLRFDGVAVLALHEGTVINATNLPIFVAALNAAGVVWRPSQTVTSDVLTIEEQARMCLGKKRFFESTAKKVAARFNQRAYFCPVCLGWHCTSLLPDYEARK